MTSSKVVPGWEASHATRNSSKRRRVSRWLFQVHENHVLELSTCAKPCATRLLLHCCSLTAGLQVSPGSPLHHWTTCTGKRPLLCHPPLLIIRYIHPSFWGGGRRERLAQTPERCFYTVTPSCRSLWKLETGHLNRAWSRRRLFKKEEGSQHRSGGLHLFSSYTPRGDHVDAAL